MATNGASSPRDGDVVNATEASLDKIKRQLASGSGRNLLQGPLLKRSETLRKWNERWIILDPTTGKMEYKIRRNDPAVKGTIVFDSNSTIMTSPYNFHGLPKYDNCIIYIATPQKKEYFLCAETPGAARAWVATLHATQLVLRAHKEAVNSLAGNSSAKLGTVSAVVTAANSTALESSKEIEAAMQIARRNALGSVLNKAPDGPLDDLTIMKETLKVKDEELQNLSRDIRARDSTIKEIAEKLTETADAAQSAASAAHTMDEQRRLAASEVDRLRKELEKQAISYTSKLRDSEEKIMVLSKEREQLIKQRDSSHQEALLWRSELGKARERVVILEGAVVRAEEKVRVKDAEAEAVIKEATEKGSVLRKENQELLACIHVLQLQLKSRQEENTKQVLEERVESCSGDTQPLTKHVHPTVKNVDKASLSDSRNIPMSERYPDRSGEWNDIEATEARIADVREISADTQGNGSGNDIPVFVHGNESQQQQQQQEGSAYYPDVPAFRQSDDTQPPEQTTDSYHHQP